MTKRIEGRPKSVKTRAQLDSFDLRLLKELQERGDLTCAEIAERVFLSPSQCSRRLQRLREDGLIENYTAVLNTAALGLDVMAYLMISLTSHDTREAEQFQTHMRSLPEVLECCKITGEADYLVKLVTTSLSRCNVLLTENILKLPQVAKMRSSVVLEKIKHTTMLPLS